VVSVTPRPLSTSGKDPVPIVQEAGWAPGAENLAPTGIRSPDRPARSSVSIPTEPPGPQTYIYLRVCQFTSLPGFQKQNKVSVSEF
jgi:hypothetical protein